MRRKKYFIVHLPLPRENINQMIFFVVVFFIIFYYYFLQFFSLSSTSSNSISYSSLLRFYCHFTMNIFFLWFPNYVEQQVLFCYIFIYSIYTHTFHPRRENSRKIWWFSFFMIVNVINFITIVVRPKAHMFACILD